MCSLLIVESPCSRVSIHIHYIYYTTALLNVDNKQIDYSDLHSRKQLLINLPFVWGRFDFLLRSLFQFVADTPERSSRSTMKQTRDLHIVKIVVEYNLQICWFSGTYFVWFDWYSSKAEVSSVWGFNAKAVRTLKGGYCAAPKTNIKYSRLSSVQHCPTLQKLKGLFFD